MNFFVEGRWFLNSLYAFTFAQIQADRMDRPVEVHTSNPGLNIAGAFPVGEDKIVRTRTLGCWHATAHPSNFVRRHLVEES